jgi:hypothetical protein
MCCYVPECDKVLHWHCYMKTVLVGMRGSVPRKHFLPGDNNVVVCKRRHLDKVLKLYKRASNEKNMGWTQNSLKGEDDPANSETMLLDWLTTQGNYVKYTVRGTKARQSCKSATKLQ